MIRLGRNLSSTRKLAVHVFQKAEQTFHFLLFFFFHVGFDKNQDLATPHCIDFSNIYLYKRN